MKAILVALTVLSLGLPAYAATDEEKFKKLLNHTTVATGPIEQIVEAGRDQQARGGVEMLLEPGDRELHRPLPVPIPSSAENP